VNNDHPTDQSATRQSPPRSLAGSARARARRWLARLLSDDAETASGTGPCSPTDQTTEEEVHVDAAT
jgi:hypothetical protein